LVFLPPLVKIPETMFSLRTTMVFLCLYFLFFLYDYSLLLFIFFSHITVILRVHCDIYTTSYNIFLNSPLHHSPLPSLHPLRIVSTDLIFSFTYTST
jgi:hypothetical protein